MSRARTGTFRTVRASGELRRSGCNGGPFQTLRTCVEGDDPEGPWACRETSVGRHLEGTGLHPLSKVSETTELKAPMPSRAGCWRGGTLAPHKCCYLFREQWGLLCQEKCPGFPVVAGPFRGTCPLNTALLEQHVSELLSPWQVGKGPVGKK